jgi:glycosidase
MALTSGMSSSAKGADARRISLAALLLAVSSFAAGTAPTVDKVEPPNWWPNQSLNQILVLVHGSALNGATVRAANPCLTISDVHANQRGTYLFANVGVGSNCTPGDDPLGITTSSGETTAPFRLDQALAQEGRFQGLSSDDVIYLIMPDRFANGDKSNDDPAISRGLFDPNDPRRYHGGDLQGIINRLPYLKSLGVTTMWLTPVYDNTNKPNAQQAVNGKPIADYHGYGTVDYYGVEEHFGDMALLKKLVDQAHAMGLKVIQDQVANHVGPGHPWVEDPPKPTWFHGTAGQHPNETWQIWDLGDAHSTPAMQRAVTDGWFVNILPDMDQEDADVARYEIQNALWWVGETGFDGIRQDTLPYVPRTFWRKWSAGLHAQYPKLRMVGEVFDTNPAVPSYFQGGTTRDGVDTGVDSVFDFPTFQAIRDVFANGRDMDTLAKVLAQDRLYPNAGLLVPFEGNHDVMRFMREPGATLAGLKLAFTYLLTMRGIPEIYYGDEIAMQGGNDPDNRRDFPPGDHSDNEMFRYVQKLLKLRAEYEPLRRGKFTSIAVADKSWIYAREEASENVLVALNNSAAPVDIDFQYERAGDYAPQLQTGPVLHIQNGSGHIHLAAHTAEIFSRTSHK